MFSADDTRTLLHNRIGLMCNTDLDGVAALFAYETTIKDSMAETIHARPDAIKTWYSLAAAVAADADVIRAPFA